MHSLAVTLAPVLAAENSKVPFYIAGGLLVAWALILSLGLGLRKERFPYNLQGQRTVSAITAVLVLGAITTAVITSGGEGEKASAAQDKYPIPPTAPEPGSVAAAAPEPSSTGAAAPAPAPSPSSAGKGSTALTLAANPAGQLAFNTKSLSAKAGSITITMTNQSPVEHDVTIAQGTTVLGKTPTFVGGSRTVALKLKPGTYTFYCSVPGHRQAGMEGTLTVS
jgi:plastocyanin